MSFKVGEKVVCIEDDSLCVNDFTIMPSPNVGDIVEIIEISKTGEWLTFIEYDYNFEYDASKFRKLDYDFVEEVIKQVTEKELAI